MKVLCNECDKEFEIIGETRTSKLLAHDCKLYNDMMQQRRVIYIKITNGDGDKGVLDRELINGDYRRRKAREKAILWKFNEECPECGNKSDHQIKACETGLSYCSKECAKTHVNKEFKEDENHE